GVAGTDDREVVDRPLHMLGEAVPPEEKTGVLVTEDAQEAVGAELELRVVDRLLVGLAELPVFVVAGGRDRQQPGATAAALMQGPRERVVGLPFPLAAEQPPFVDDRGARVDAVAEPPVRGEQLVEAVSLLA